MHRFDHVQVIGVDEHVWRHTRIGNKDVTAVIDLAPVRSRSGPHRLLDMVEGRSMQVFKQWLRRPPNAWKQHVELVATDGFTGFKTAASEEVPDAVPVTDPFHVVQLSGNSLDRCRQRVQQETCGHRGRADDPLHTARWTLHTGDSPLTSDTHVAVEATWGVYQKMVSPTGSPTQTPGNR